MATKRLTPLDLNGLEILNVLAQLIAGNPGSPVEGQFWYDSTAKTFKFRTNAANIDVLARSTHTGSQTASTISDFDTQVRTSRLDQMAAAGADVSMASHKITNVTDPGSPQDAATKNYVDNLVNGFDWKASVRAATTANITLSGAQTIDGVSVIAGDRVLVKDQSLGQNNGIYVAASGAWARATDADASSEVTSGMATFVEEGTTNGNQQWALTTDNPITLGSTLLVFAQTGATGTAPTAGAGLTLASNTYDVVAGSTPGSGGPGGGLKANADDLVIDKDVVVRKYAVDVGDGSSVSITITHNLGTKDVIFTLYDKTTPYQEVLCDVQHTTTNTLTLVFAVAPTAAQYRAVVHA